MTALSAPKLLLAFALLAATAASCSIERGEEGAEPAPLAPQLALLPDAPPLRRQILFGNFARLRAAYPGGADLRRALAGVWLPDALSGAEGPLWRRSFGFDLEGIDRFASAGFHPGELLVASGRFRPWAVRATLRARGYVRKGGLMQRGADGSFDARTLAGRLALSSLNRIRVGDRRLTAASTTALAEAAAAPQETLAEDRDLAAAAEALGQVTAAAFFPAAIVRPLEGAFVLPLTQHPALLFAVAIDDRGPGQRTVKLVLVYANGAAAEADAAVLKSELADTALPSMQQEHFGEILEGLAVQVRSGRAVLVRGELRPDEHPGLWRSLLERGDLAVVVRRS